MLPKICVAFPVNNDDLTQLKKSIFALQQHNPDLVELRFDYINDVNKITEEFIEKLKSFFTKNVELIFTLRDFSEGGNMRISETKKFNVFTTLLKEKPQFLDIEINSSRKVLSQIIELANEYNVNIILSYHNFDASPTFEEAMQLHELNMKKIEGLFVNISSFNEKILYKYIFTARKFQDNLLCLKLSEHLKKANQKVICFCMGDLGLISRILCVNFGSPFTYGYFSESTAPGQIHIEDMRKIFQAISKI